MTHWLNRQNEEISSSTLKLHSGAAHTLPIMRPRLNAVLERLLAEVRHHAHAAGNTPVYIKPARSRGERIALLATSAFGIAMIPVAAALPILPTWPFVLLALVAAARNSSRVRTWLAHNHVFTTLVHVVRHRPERIFRFTDRMLSKLLGV